MSNYNAAQLTLILLLHYLVKCRSRGVVIYNNEFILGSACVGSENHWDHKIIFLKFVIYLTLIVHLFVLRSYVDDLKWLIKSEWAALGHAVTEHAVGKWRQRLRVWVGAVAKQ